jgi:hypothetical protein
MEMPCSVQDQGWPSEAFVTATLSHNPLKGTEMKNLTIALACVGMSLACADQNALDVGDETSNLGQALADYAANWDGYTEAFSVPGDGEDRVRLTLDENGAGVIRFGEEALFPAATDPEGPYPLTFPDHERPIGGVAAPRTGLRSGFEFSVIGASVSGERLQFQTNVGEIMDSWCALQALEPFAGFKCGGGSGYSTSDTGICWTGEVAIDCDVAFQCSSCECDVASCQARRAGYDIDVDAALTDDGNTLEGTMLTTDGDRVTIRMTR